MAWNLFALPMLLTCSMNSSGKGWKDWMMRRGDELSSREREGGQNSVLQLERGGMRKSELVLGSNLLKKALTAITKLPLSSITRTRRVNR